MTSNETVVRPAYRPYSARVSRVIRLAPHFVRVTFTGDDLVHFGTAGLDQRIKVVFPRPDGSFAELFRREEDAGEWYTLWRALPLAERNPFRTYTVRRIDPAAAELDIDFVLHDHAGPAGTWAQAAAVGDELVVVGPDGRSPESRGGIDWHPGTARRLLLAGDETAAPAICGILESLAPACDVDAFVEVPTAADVLEPALGPSTRLHWLPRDGAEHGAPLIEAVASWTRANADVLARAAAPRPQVLDDIDVDVDLLWDSPEDGEGEFYSWIAGESATIKTLRRLLVTECGVDRRRVAFMGYWRLGQAERTE